MNHRSTKPTARIVAKLNAEWSAAVKARDGRCRVTGNTFNVDPAHIIPRSQSLALHWRLANGVTLDHRLHMAYEADPQRWDREAPNIIGWTLYRELIEESRIIIHSPPLHWYQEQLKRLRSDLQDAL